MLSGVNVTRISRDRDFSSRHYCVARTPQYLVPISSIKSFLIRLKKIALVFNRRKYFNVVFEQDVTIHQCTSTQPPFFCCYSKLSHLLDQELPRRQLLVPSSVCRGGDNLCGLLYSAGTQRHYTITSVLMCSCPP